MKLNNVFSKLSIASVTLISTIVIASSANARGIAEGTITKVTSAANTTNVFLSVKSTAVPGEVRPSCATTDAYFVLTAAQKSQLAVMLTALALESNVKIVGKGTCDANGLAEDVSFVQVVK